MVERRKGKKKDSAPSKGSRQKDRDDEPVEFVSMGEPVFVDREGSSNFLQIERKQVIGKESEEIKSEFVQLNPGFYNRDGEPRFNKKCPECGRGQGITWSPSMTDGMLKAIEGTVTEDEAEEFGWDDDEEDDE